MPAIETRCLTKTYNSQAAVCDLSFEVAKGEIFGIVGPNGAGKTTTLKMLSGLIAPASGDIRINGLGYGTHALEIKQTLGYLPEESPLYEGMRAHDYLMFFAEVFGVEKKVAKERIDSLLEALQLDAGDRKIGDMSKGMQRKVAIARALINDPEILIFDEMTSGLDPITSKYLVDFVGSLRERGKTVVFSAHNLYQVETLCDRILILKNGRQVAAGTLADIKRSCGGVEYSIDFKSEKPQFDVESKNGSYVFSTSERDEFTGVTQWAASHGEILDIRTRELPLEEIFLRLMKD
ncbi:MAG TPA: ABC transporter ATP-binding protein [Candidatus Methanoperedenaceae archaeon]|nr:ABC transporter ATP-binding protein [Candidatus Methanoperedenaceae archaeon]